MILAGGQPFPPDVATDLQSLVAGNRFGTIYADPPWTYDNRASRGAACKHYKTMSVAAITAMGDVIRQLAADDAHLHLWTTNAFHRQSYDIIRAWGFEPRSEFIWVKPQMGIGNYWRLSHEYLMLGIRGDAKSFADHSLRSWAELDRTEHSRKPEAVRAMIEKASPGPYLELFARRTSPEWTVWGDEVKRVPLLFEPARSRA